MALLFFICLCGCNPEPRQIIIALQPLEFQNKQQLAVIRQSLSETYHARVVVLPDKEIPQRFSVRNKPARYRADSLLSFLQKTKPDSISFILGVTTMDISITKKDEHGVVKNPASKYNDWGVFGYGFQPGTSCVVSTFRLGSNKKILLQRLQKISLHEVGHNMGLKHCTDENCYMTDAVESIVRVDHASSTLCDQCRKNH